MKYIPPLDGDLGNADRPYIDGDPASGTEGSVVPAAAIEHPQREILSVLAAAGIVPDPTNLAQLLQAIIALIEEAAPGTIDIVAGTTGTLTVARGGTGATTDGAARAALDVPTRTGGDASGTWDIDISGSAAAATDATKLGGALPSAYATLASSPSFAGGVTGKGSVRADVPLNTGSSYLSAGYYDANSRGIYILGYGPEHASAPGRSIIYMSWQGGVTTYGGVIDSRGDLGAAGYLNVAPPSGAPSNAVHVSGYRILTTLDQPATYTSAEQALVLGGRITLAHGLGAKPRRWSYALICKTAELGYAVGDEINDVHDSAAATLPITLGADASNLYVAVPSVGLNTLNRSAAGGGTITPGNWRIIARAEK